MLKLCISLVILTSLTAALPACEPARQAAITGVGVLLDCTREDLAGVVAELQPLAEQAIIAAIAPDGSVDASKLRAAAGKLRGDLGRCVLAAAVAALIRAPATSASGAALAAGPPADPGALRAAFERLRPELGDVRFQTPAGVL